MTLSQNNYLLKKSAAMASVFVAVMLIVLKLIAFIKTDSLAVFSSLIDSVTDLFASFISGVAVYFSMKPATCKHRYGYGKSEALSALLQAIFVGASGVFVIFDGINRLFNPVEVGQTGVGIWVMLFSIFSTIVLVCFQSYVAKKTNSLAIKADMAHYVVDFLTNGTVVVSLILVKMFDFVYFDVIAALFISLYLLYNAYELGKESIEQIIDTELSDEIRSNIENIAVKCDGVHGIHDLRTRNVGEIYYIELHIEMDGEISLNNAHKITDNVEKMLLNEYPNSQILIHQDPLGVDEIRLDNQFGEKCKI